MDDPSLPLEGPGLAFNDIGQWYEVYIAALAKLRGYIVRKPRPRTVMGSGDYGADWLLYIYEQDTHPTWAVQCKFRQENVGLTAVQEVHAARDYYRALYACVVAPTAFTEPAQEIAGALGVSLYTLGRDDWATGWSDLPPADHFRHPPSNLLTEEEIRQFITEQYQALIPWPSGINPYSVQRVAVEQVQLGRVRGTWAYSVQGSAWTSGGLFAGPQKISWTLVINAATCARLPVHQLDPGTEWGE